MTRDPYDLPYGHPLRRDEAEDIEAMLTEAEQLEAAARMGTGGSDIDPGDAAEMRADMRRRAAELRERAKGC
jgi:hypothetical protein